MYQVEKIEIVGNKVFCTIHNKYEKFNSIPIENLKLIRKNNKLYAKLKIWWTKWGKKRGEIEIIYGMWEKLSIKKGIKDFLNKKKK